MAATPNVVANGNISPSRFVVIDATAGKRHMVIQSTANSAPILGVAQDGTREAPGTPADDGFAAIAGEGLQIFGDGEECLVVAGGTVTHGDTVASDANGKAVTLNLAAATGVQHSGGIALADAAANELFRILVRPISHRAT